MTDDLRAWPDYILDYAPLNDDYAVELPAPFARTDFEEGLARQEKIFTNAPTTFACTWPMTPTQYEIWLGWLHNTGGIYGWFSAPMFRGDAYEAMKCRIVKGSLTSKRSGGEWIVICKVETADYAPYDATTVAAAMLTYGADESLAEIVAMLQAATEDLIAFSEGAEAAS